MICSFISNQNFAQEKNEKELLSQETVGGLKLRCIGPAFSSGRIADFAVNPYKPSEYYAAFASGGVWKTTNSDASWTPGRFPQFNK